MRERWCVVDTVTDHGDLAPTGLDLLDLARLVLGAHSREVPIDPQFPGDRSRHSLSITGDHDDLDTDPVQRFDSFARLRADLVGQLEPTDHGSVDQDVQDDRPVGPPTVGNLELRLLGEREQVGTSDLHLRAADPSLDTGRGRRREVRRCGQCEVPLLRGADDGLGQGVLTVELGRGSQRQDLVGFEAGDGLDRCHDRLATRQGAGLVEQHRIDGAHAFERQPVLDQQSATGCALGRDRDDQRDRQAQGVRAGDDQHRDGAHDCVVRQTDKRPHDGSDDRGDQREPEQVPGRLVGDALSPRRGRLGLRDEPLNSRKSGLVAGGGDLDTEAGVGRHGAGGYRIALAAGDWARLAGDHGLIDLGPTVSDGAIGGNAPSGSDHDDVSDAQLARSDDLDPITGHPFGLVGQERRERVQSGHRLGQ